MCQPFRGDEYQYTLKAEHVVSESPTDPHVADIQASVELLVIESSEMFQNLLISYWDLLFNRQFGMEITNIDMN